MSKIDEKSCISILNYYICNLVSESHIKAVCKNMDFETNKYTDMFNSIISKSNWSNKQKNAVVTYITLNGSYLSHGIAKLFSIVMDEAVDYYCLSEGSAYGGDY